MHSHKLSHELEKMPLWPEFVRKREAKQQIVREIIDRFLNEGTRFLIKNKNTKEWLIASDQVMMKKVGQALREKERIKQG